MQRETRTIILYEAPHRLVRTLAELLEALGDRRMTVCRELTKKHETVFAATIAQALEYYKNTEPKGECVLVIEGKSRRELEEEAKASWDDISIPEHMENYLSQGVEKKEAMKLVAKDRGISKREVYQALLKNQRFPVENEPSKDKY